MKHLKRLAFGLLVLASFVGCGVLIYMYPISFGIGLVLCIAYAIGMDAHNKGVWF